MDVTAAIFVVALLATPILLALALWKWRAAIGRAKRAEEDVEQLRLRFAGILDADAEAARIRAETEVTTSDFDELKASYLEKKAIYDRLLQEVAIFDERLSFAEMGVYEPHFEFTDSDEYKGAIQEVRELQKATVSAKTAVQCPTKWHVDGSYSKGETMTNRNIRLTLRAFNNECEAAIANTRWNNVNAMEKRILRAQEQIDKMNASNTTYISHQYVALKLQELYLTHEYRDKVKAEREERAEVARLAREEQKLLRDLERAEEEEAHYAKLLEKAKAEARQIVGPQLKVFEQQIATLEKDLAAAQAKAERAKAMAERTRSGYVYIISNIGSFGEGVVKIGLTRRLDPVERVRELGDASVPFTFDTHAMIYSDDAPALEHALHAEFESTRINMQNMRKEFFRASMEEVHAAVKQLAPAAQFFTDIEAQEYRETVARRESQLAHEAALESAEFPAEL
jgi:hypothetical protein